MELMTGFGVVAKELFDYNRDMYKFDQMQRLERDLLRLEMQVKRFELFREDIRDLVELTVGKMEMYHLVGALFLEFCVAFYVEGKIETVEVPPFTIALYYLSVAGAFMYLVLAVWLSMHASISSHSFGVRLLTRYVRLPIPGAKQMGAMNARLAEFEHEGLGMFRVPFAQGAQQWDRTAPGAVGGPGSPEGGQAAPAAAAPAEAYGRAGRDHLGKGEQPYAQSEAALMKACRRGLAGEHISLFRKLQARWQCYDAYARVCMSLGAIQILMSVSCYMINVCMVEYRSPSACFVLVAVFQATALSLSFLDIAGVRKATVLVVQAIGTAPCILAVVLLTMEGTIEMSEEGEWKGVDPLKKYPLSPVCFFLMVIWLEAMIRLAWPSKDEATLPRRFRSVLFLDVFSDLTHDPTEAEENVLEGAEDEDENVDRRSSAKKRSKPSLEQVSAADDACEIAHQALRRWETVPEAFDVGSQRQEAKQLRGELRVWRQALLDEIKAQAKKSNVRWPPELLQQENKPYYELSQEELSEDRFRGQLVGPVNLQDGRGGASTYFWDVDHKEMLTNPGRTQVLTLHDVARHIADAQGEVRKVIGEDKAARTADHSSFSDDSDDSGSDDGGTCCTRSRRSEWNPEDGPYVPQRLPWKIMHLCTRALQFAWLFQGVMFTLQELGIVELDFSRVEKHGEGGREEEEQAEGLRRLLQSDLWEVDEVSVEWPHGTFFRPEGALSCLAHGASAEASSVDSSPPGTILLSTPHAMHASSYQGTDVQQTNSTLKLKPLQPHFMPGAVAVCEPAGEASNERAMYERCVFVRPAKGGVEFRDFSGASTVLNIETALNVKHRDWKSIAAAHVRCSEVVDMLVGGPEDSSIGDDPASITALLEGSAPVREPKTDWCVRLAGWSGDRSVHVAAVPLRAGPGSLPPPGEAVVPVLELPLRKAATALARSGVVLSMQQGMLWALQGDGTMTAWNVTSPQRVGHWRLRWKQEDDSVAVDGFHPSGFCEIRRRNNVDAERNLLIVGRTTSGGPTLYRAKLKGESDPLSELGARDL